MSESVPVYVLVVPDALCVLLVSWLYAVRCNLEPNTMRFLLQPSIVRKRAVCSVCRVRCFVRDKRSSLAAVEGAYGRATGDALYIGAGI